MNYHDKPESATTKDIQTWESSFGVKMLDDLRTLLLESNGPVLYDDETGKEIQFLSTTDAIEYYDGYQFTQYCKEAIPVAMDGCGNFVVYRIKENEIKELFGISATNLGWHDSVQLSDGIQTLISMKELIEDKISEQGM